EPQRRLEGVEAAPLVGLALPDAPVRGPDVLPVGAGTGQPGQEALQGLFDPPVHDVHVRLVRRPGVLGDLGADGAHDVLGDLAEERPQVVLEFGRQVLRPGVVSWRWGPGVGVVSPRGRSGAGVVHGAPSVSGTSKAGSVTLPGSNSSGPS